MNYVLLDIKNFLKKLESGQLELEAGQWKLHKDITNVKKAVEELKALKEDFEKMRQNNVEQFNLIKSLEEKIDHFQKDGESNELPTAAESVEYERVHKRQSDDPAKGYKKRKCHVVPSEEIIEITSQVSDDNSESTQESKTESKASNDTQETYESGKRRSQGISPKTHTARSEKSEMIQRYLKDSAKYKEKKPSQEAQCCQKEEKSNQDPGNTPFWDEYRAPANSKLKENASKSEKKSESILPTRLACPRCPRKFTYKIDFLKHEKEHRRAKAKFTCPTCGKGFHGRNRLKMHSLVHKASLRDSKGYLCSYCDMVCSTPEKLTAHLRECRTIRKSRFRRHKF